MHLHVIDETMLAGTDRALRAPTATASTEPSRLHNNITYCSADRPTSLITRLYVIMPATVTAARIMTMLIIIALYWIKFFSKQTSDPARVQPS